MRQAAAGVHSVRTTNRLFRQDRLIAWNGLRAAFARRHDRVIVALMLLAALAAARAWFADRTWTMAAWAALGIGTLTGIGAGRLVGDRLAFHAFDGLLAADALNPRIRRRYMAAWHGIGLALLAAVTLVVRPSLLIVGVPAYLAGASVAGLTGGVGMPGRVAGIGRPGWTIRRWAHRPVAGVSAAAILLLALLPARALGPDTPSAAIGIATVLLALMLTGVDDGIVRFMAIAGYDAPRIVARHAKGVGCFLAVALCGCGILFGPTAAGIVAAAGAAVLLLMTVRILAYRLHARRFADILVAFLAGLLMPVAYAMPVALPVMGPAMVWLLHRRGRAKTWSLA